MADREVPGFLLCNGASLAWHDLNQLDGIPTMGVNVSWRFYRATWHTALDSEHFDSGSMNEWIYDYDDAHIFTLPERARGTKFPRIRKPTPSSPEWSWDPPTGVYARFSGMFALQVLVWLGANRVWILGMDGMNHPGQGGHCYPPNKPVASSLAGAHNAHLRMILPEVRARGVEFWTCAKPTAIDAVPYMEYDEAIVEARRMLCEHPLPFPLSSGN